MVLSHISVIEDPVGLRARALTSAGGKDRDIASHAKDRSTNHLDEGERMAVKEASISRDAQAVLEAIVYLYTESRRLTKELAREAHLTGPQLTVLKGLQQIGPLSLTELSERIRAQNSTVTGIIDRMEREELVVRARSTVDRRVVEIRLTHKGRAIAEQVPIAPMELFRDALATLTGAEMKEFLRILTKISSRVREHASNDSKVQTTVKESR